MTIPSVGPSDNTVPAFQTAASSAGGLSYTEMYNEVSSGLLTASQYYNTIAQGIYDVYSQVSGSVAPVEPTAPIAPNPLDPKYADPTDLTKHNNQYFIDCDTYSKALSIYTTQEAVYTNHLAIYHNYEAYTDLYNQFSEYAGNPSSTEVYNPAKPYSANTFQDVVNYLAPSARQGTITQADYDNVTNYLSSSNDAGPLNVLTGELGLGQSTSAYPDLLKSIPAPGGSGQTLYDLAMDAKNQLNGVIVAIGKGFTPYDPNAPDNPPHD